MSAEGFDTFRKHIAEVLPFGVKVKERLIKLGKLNKTVRVLCPNPAHAGASPSVYVRAWVGGSRNHLHMGCEDPDCYYRVME